LYALSATTKPTNKSYNHPKTQQSLATKSTKTAEIAMLPKKGQDKEKSLARLRTQYMKSGKES